MAEQVQTQETVHISFPRGWHDTQLLEQDDRDFQPIGLSGEAPDILDGRIAAPGLYGLYLG